MNRTPNLEVKSLQAGFIRNNLFATFTQYSDAKRTADDVVDETEAERYALGLRLLETGVTQGLLVSSDVREEVELLLSTLETSKNERFTFWLKKIVILAAFINELREEFPDIELQLLSYEEKHRTKCDFLYNGYPVMCLNARDGKYFYYTKNKKLRLPLPGTPGKRDGIVPSLQRKYDIATATTAVHPLYVQVPFDRVVLNKEYIGLKR